MNKGNGRVVQHQKVYNAQRSSILVVVILVKRRQHNQITPSAMCIGLNVSESYTTMKMYTPNWSSALCIGLEVIIVYTCMTEHTALG